MGRSTQGTYASRFLHSSRHVHPETDTDVWLGQYGHESEVAFGQGLIGLSDDFPRYSCAGDLSGPTVYRLMRATLADARRQADERLAQLTESDTIEAFADHWTAQPIFAALGRIIDIHRHRNY